jgi:hypothetical protein
MGWSQIAMVISVLAFIVACVAMGIAYSAVKLEREQRARRRSKAQVFQKHAVFVSTTPVPKSTTEEAFSPTINGKK